MPIFLFCDVGQGKAAPSVDNGNDSDATIVEGSDGGDTEVCAEETVFNGYGRQISVGDDDEDDTEEDQRDDDYKPSSKYRLPKSKKGKKLYIFPYSSRVKHYYSIQIHYLRDFSLIKYLRCCFPRLLFI